MLHTRCYSFVCSARARVDSKIKTQHPELPSSHKPSAPAKARAENGPDKKRLSYILHIDNHIMYDHGQARYLRYRQ